MPDDSLDWMRLPPLPGSESPEQLREREQWEKEFVWFFGVKPEDWKPNPHSGMEVQRIIAELEAGIRKDKTEPEA